jgi:polyisoprenoid-binding protein YceI
MRHHSTATADAPADTTAATTPAGRRTTSVARAAGQPAGVRPGRWTIDASRSTLQVSVRVGGVATVRGRFTDLRGQVDVAQDPQDSCIDASVATASLTSGSAHWDQVLTSAGLVDTQANPEIAFSAVGLHPAGPPGANRWQLEGILVTARGLLEVRFDLTCLGAGPDELRFLATGAVSSKEAVHLLSRPGFEKLIGRSMSIELAITARAPRD